ncbi:MAG: potassium transporter TrkG [Dokdonella sp.]
MLNGLRHPTRLIPLAFLIVVLLGTALLMLPIASADHQTAALHVALFTSVSAVCVTGLGVVDTPVYWSTFGQAVILLLIQVGGFGIMTGATLLGLLVADRLRLGTRMLAQAETRSTGLGNVTSVLKLIVIVTLVVELAIAALLAKRLHVHYGEPWREAVWNGVFQSISAFNNAGFSTYSNSLIGFATDPLVIFPIMTAIVIGGIGFPVLYEIRKSGLHWGRWSLHTRITLLGSAILALFGTLAIFAYEQANVATIGTFSTGEKWLIAAFHSISARTAGFNSVDVGQMHQETLAVHYVLMFIGGGSAGTAGGIKVTTFFLLGLVVWAEIRGTEDANIFGRRISMHTQRQALSVALLGAAAVGLATLALLSLTALPMHVLLFEAISAFATVGLSTGITADLPIAGQGVLIVLMFIGRVGTITVATALALRGRPAHFRYPEERPIVG